MVAAVAVTVAAAVAAAVATMPTDVRAVGLMWVEQSSTGGDIEQRQNMHAATATSPMTSPGPATCTIATTCAAGVLSSASRTIPIGTVGSVRRQLTQKRMNEQVLVPRPDHVTSVAAA